jgi:predicted metal-dependent enzyme (double-stranded beta helix superfamily)
MSNLAKLRTFISAFTCLIETQPDEKEIFNTGGQLLSELIATDDWLPEAYAQPHPQFYQQYLLHADPLERFSVVSFVWGPGQTTPIHDHTVWGIIGMLRGSEFSQGFELSVDNKLVESGEPVHMKPGQIEYLSPAAGDVHQVSNADTSSVSISIHVYGANIGAVKRSVFKEDGTRKLFTSGYTNTAIPNVWDRSKEFV